MSFINHASREINLKIVYWGPSLSGKTTNLQYIYDKSNPDSKGKLTSLQTEAHRTTVFEFLPLDFGTVRDLRVRLHLYTTPSVDHGTQRSRLFLRGVDGIVFVADSQRSRADSNRAAFEDLAADLKGSDLELVTVPYVLQLNKRDLLDILPEDEMKRTLSHRGRESIVIGSAAHQGIGVFETLKAIVELVVAGLASADAQDASAPGPGVPRSSGPSLRQVAERLEKAGKLEQAIPLYRQLLEDNPRDWNTINKIGDLFAKIGKMREAGDEYAKVAEFYARDGFHLKAIAIWKKINKLDPAVVEPYAKLADLYAKQGLVMEAKGQYQIVSDDQLKRGQLKEAAETLRKMVEIDSSDLKTRSRLADIYTKEGSTAKAVDEYIAISEELNLKGHPAEAIQVLEKGKEIDSGMKVRARLGKAHIAQRSYDMAITYLEEVTAQEPSSEAMMHLWQAYLGAKRDTDARVTLESILKRFPESEEARNILAADARTRTPKVRAVGASSLGVPRALATETAVRSTGMLADIKIDGDFIEEHLAESRVFRKYGLLDKAEEQVDLVLVRYPNTFDGRLEKKEIFKATERIGEAASECAWLADAAREAGNNMLAQVLSNEIEELNARLDSLRKKDSLLWEEYLAEGRALLESGLIYKAAERFKVIVARFPNHVEARKALAELEREIEIEQLLVDGPRAPGQNASPTADRLVRAADAPLASPIIQNRAAPTSEPTAPNEALPAQPASGGDPLTAAIDMALAAPFSNDEHGVLRIHIEMALREIGAQRRLRTLGESIEDQLIAGRLRVFLCHASEDKASVRMLHRRLRDAGVAAWLDDEELLPGMNWESEIEKAVRASDVVLVCLSPRSVPKKGFVQKEIRRVLDMAEHQPEDTIFLIPLLLEPCEVPERLRKWQWLGYYEDGAHLKLMRALARRTTSLVER